VTGFKDDWTSPQAGEVFFILLGYHLQAFIDQLEFLENEPMKEVRDSSSLPGNIIHS
jgi:hypothetical protein